jgi:biopolymer transport protein ExbD
MSRTMTGATKCEINLTPILDMVFQLITFFMLVINFKSAELDMKLRLPVVGSARPVHGAGKLLVLNIRSEEKTPCLSLYGRLIPEGDIKSYLLGEQQASLMAAKFTLDDIHEGGKELPDVVVIRADETAPFGHVNYVITTCQELGYRKFALKALANRAAATP